MIEDILERFPSNHFFNVIIISNIPNIINKPLHIVMICKGAVVKDVMFRIAYKKSVKADHFDFP